MNKFTVALCYFAGLDPASLDEVRKSLSAFGTRTEYLVPSLTSPSRLYAYTLELSRGYDLAVVVTDNAVPHSQFLLKGYTNNNPEDLWAMMVVSVSLAILREYQPTIAIESERYMGSYYVADLPTDLLAFTKSNRKQLHNRGL